MGLTQGKLPWPAGTELVRDGDNAIRALAEAADPVTLKGLRTSSDGIAASNWANVVGPAVAVMPAGTYLMQAHLFWTYEPGGSAYTWAKFLMNGITIGGSGRTVGGWSRPGGGSAEPIHHSWTDIVQFAGPQTMTLELQTGFADVTIWVHSGCSVFAVRLGPQ
jgi:hypothetical protein